MSPNNNRKIIRRSGLNANDIEQLTLWIYCFFGLARKQKHRNTVIAPLFKYIAATIYLTQPSTFGSTYDSAQCNKMKKDGGNCDRVANKHCREHVVVCRGDEIVEGPDGEQESSVSSRKLSEYKEE